MTCPGENGQIRSIYLTVLYILDIQGKWALFAADVTSIILIFFPPNSYDIDGHLILVMFILLILVFWVLHRCSFLFLYFSILGFTQVFILISVRIISFQIHGTPLDGF